MPAGRRSGVRLHLRGLLRVRGGADAAAAHAAAAPNASAADDDVAAAAAPVLAADEGAPESVARTGEEPFFRG